MPRSHVNAIARTPQTDPEAFPEYVHQSYPKMMNKDPDPDTGKIEPHTHPDGKPVIVQDEEEHKAFLASLQPKGRTKATEPADLVEKTETVEDEADGAKTKKKRSKKKE